MGPFDDVAAPSELSFAELFFMCTGIDFEGEKIGDWASRAGRPSSTDVVWALGAVGPDLLGRVGCTMAGSVGESDRAVDVQTPSALVGIVASRYLEPEVARALLLLGAASWWAREVGAVAWLTGLDVEVIEAAERSMDGPPPVEQRRGLYLALAGLWPSLVAEAGDQLRTVPGLGMALVVDGYPPIALADEVRRLLPDLCCDQAAAWPASMFRRRRGLWLLVAAEILLGVIAVVVGLCSGTGRYTLRPRMRRR